MAAGRRSEVDDAAPVGFRAVAGRPTQEMAAEHHLVIWTGEERPKWADVVIGDGEAVVDTLVTDRLLPWATRWRQGRRAPRNQTAVLQEPDPTWAPAADRLIARLRAATRHTPVRRIDHIGSTSVPGLAAKDLVDIQILTTEPGATVEIAEAAAGAGFVHVSGEWFGKDRSGGRHPEQVCVDADPGRPVNVNVRSADAPVARDALLFRDWLRADAAARDRYQALKVELAGRHVDDYGDRKEPFISSALDEAEAWAAETGWLLDR